MRLSWQINDMSGSLLREESIDFNFTAAGEQRRHTISLQVPRPGWYGLKFSLAPCDASGEAVFRPLSRLRRSRA